MKNYSVSIKPYGLTAAWNSNELHGKNSAKDAVHGFFHLHTKHTLKKLDLTETPDQSFFKGVATTEEDKIFDVFDVIVKKHSEIQPL